eukprot:COSAG01_NODE_3815_length_5671_cov_2.363604_9_plen_112_part_00
MARGGRSRRSRAAPPVAAAAEAAPTAEPLQAPAGGYLATAGAPTRTRGRAPGGFDAMNIWEKLAQWFVMVLGVSLAARGYYISAAVVGAILIIPHLHELLDPGVTDRLNEQ